MGLMGCEICVFRAQCLFVCQISPFTGDMVRVALSASTCQIQPRSRPRSESAEHSAELEAV